MRAQNRHSINSLLWKSQKGGDDAMNLNHAEHDRATDHPTRRYPQPTPPAARLQRWPAADAPLEIKKPKQRLDVSIGPQSL